MYYCVYNRMSPCDNCGRCRTKRFKDDEVTCDECENTVYGDETIFIYDDKYFCSIECIIKYLYNLGEIKSVTLNDNEVETCYYCGDEITNEYEAFTFDDKYFCTDECIGKYLSDIVKTKRLLTAEDYEADYGDIEYDRIKDEELI